MLAFGVKETSTTTGTGNLTVAGVTGFPRFSNAFPSGVGRRFEYAILDSNGAPIENGIGYMSGTNTLVREKIVATFDSAVYDDTAPAAVMLAAGTKTVICTQGMVTSPITAPNIDSGSTSNAPRRVAYDPFINFASANSTGFTLVANTLYLLPFYLGQAIECSGIQVRVGTGVSAKSVRLGLYELGSAGYPKQLLGETGSLAAATSGVDVSGSFAANLRLNAGWYCVGMVSDGAIAVGTTSGIQASFLGGSTSNLLVSVSGRNVGYTFGALPNPATTATNADLGGTNRIIFALTAV